MFFWSRTPNLLLTFRWRRFFFRTLTACYGLICERCVCLNVCVRYGAYIPHIVAVRCEHMWVCVAGIWQPALFVRMHGNGSGAAVCVCVCDRHITSRPQNVEQFARFYPVYFYFWSNAWASIAAVCIFFGTHMMEQNLHIAVYWPSPWFNIRWLLTHATHLRDLI